MATVMPAAPVPTTQMSASMGAPEGISLASRMLTRQRSGGSHFRAAHRDLFNMLTKVFWSGDIASRSGYIGWDSGGQTIIPTRLSHVADVSATGRHGWRQTCSPEGNRGFPQSCAAWDLYQVLVDTIDGELQARQARGDNCAIVPLSPSFAGRAVARRPRAVVAT